MSRRKGEVTYTADPYRTRVILAKTEAALDRLTAEYGLIPNASALGLCYMGTDPIIIRVRDGNILTLMHECCHAVLSIFGHCGIDPAASNGEPMCYLMEHMVAHFMPHLSPALPPASTHPDGCTDAASAGPCVPSPLPPP